MADPVAAAPAPAAAPVAAAPAPATAPAAAPAVVTASSAAPWMEPPKPAEAAKPDAEPAKPEAAKAEPAKPEKITIKAPEGVTIEAARLEKFGADMSALGVTQDVAQKLFERDLAAEKASREADMVAMKATNENWGKQLKSEWGEKYGEYAELTKRGFDYIDPDGSMRKELEGINAHNWPKLLNGIRKVGEMLREDKLHAPSNAVPAPKLSPEERLKRGYQERMAGAKK